MMGVLLKTMSVLVDMLLVWLFPIFGLRLPNKKAKLGLYEQFQQNGSGDWVKMGLLELDVIFNPGAKNQIKDVQEHKVQVVKKNEQQDDDLPHKNN